MAIPNLFDPTLERALPLSRGADLRFSVYDDTTNPPTAWPMGTIGIVEIDHGAFYANSDRNAFGTRNVAAGLDNFDFRDLGWKV